MAKSRSFFVCRFALPASLRRADLADWIEQMLSMHAGINVRVVSEEESLKIFADNEEGGKIVQTAVETNREDWRGVGVDAVTYN